MNEHGSVILEAQRTEKSVKLASFDRVLMFKVNSKSTKPQIKEAVENMFKAKVEKVRVHINRKGDKVAFVKFSAETDMESIASSLKIV